MRQANDFPSLAGDLIGAFRTVCQRSHFAYDDAIVRFGQPGAAHLHVFFGNTAADAFSTHETLRSAGDGTCRGGIANRSSYWLPAVIDGQGHVIEPVELHVYAKEGYWGLQGKIQRFPTGLKAVVGDMNARAGQDTGSVWWDCVDGSRPRSATILDCGGGQVQQNAAFGQCWSGELDSPDHKSHLIRAQNDSCPASHPIAIPEYSFHLRYPALPPDARLVSDDADGLRGVSNHADWMEGWDEELSTRFLENVIKPHRDGGSHRLGLGWILE